MQLREGTNPLNKMTKTKKKNMNIPENKLKELLSWKILLFELFRKIFEIKVLTKCNNYDIIIL